MSLSEEQPSEPKDREPSQHVRFRHKILPSHLAKDRPSRRREGEERLFMLFGLWTVEPRIQHSLSPAPQNLSHLASFVPEELRDELYQRADVPLEIGSDEDADGRKYVLSEHNRDGNSYRSPWTSRYYPPIENGLQPSDRLRSIELDLNEAFDKYRGMYFGKSSVSSVYLWDGPGEGSGFAGCVCIVNQIDDGGEKSYWNSKHFVDACSPSGGSCMYTLTSTVMLCISPDDGDKSSTYISGSLVRQNKREFRLEEERGHIVNIGKFVEDVECDMRSELDNLYIQRTKNVVEMVRTERSSGPTQGQQHTKVLNEAVLSMAMSRKAKVANK